MKISFLYKRLIGSLIIGISIIGTPLNTVSAATYVVDLSQFSTPQEKINHLKGILAVLQAQLATLRTTQAGTNVSNSNNLNRNVLSVTTLEAQNIREDTAELRGRFDMNAENYVTAWFEYGETRELYERSTIARIEGGQEEIRVFVNRINNLKDNTTYYYRLVVESDRGVRSFGTIRSFKTLDENAAASVVVSDQRIEIGETMVFNWYIPKHLINPANWIGIYQIGASHTDVVEWIRAKTATGNISLKATERGSYEARLFKKDTYEVIAVSEVIEVTN